MNFGVVLRTVTGFLEEQRIGFAVIGGVALASYGLPRTSVDRARVRATFEQHGLEERYEDLERTL